MDVILGEGSDDGPVIVLSDRSSYRIQRPRVRAFVDSIIRADQRRTVEGD